MAGKQIGRVAEGSGSLIPHGDPSTLKANTHRPRRFSRGVVPQKTVAILLSKDCKTQSVCR